MNTTTINHHLRNLPCFIGTFPRDQLPKLKNKPCGVIFNTDDSKRPGSHWIAMFFTEDGRGEFIDPFGLPPLFQDVQEYLSANSPSGWQHNTTTLQSLDSDTCGYYCILFMKLRCANISLKKIMKMFTDNTFINDQIIKDYIG